MCAVLAADALGSEGWNSGFRRDPFHFAPTELGGNSSTNVCELDLRFRAGDQVVTSTYFEGDHTADAVSCGRFEYGRAARLAAIPAGESPANRRSPVAVVVISSNGEGDRSVESLEVKVPEGWAFQSDPYRGASNLAGCSESEPEKPRNLPPARNGLRECRECRAGGHSAKANVGIEFLDIDVELPGVGEDGMPGRNEQ